MKIMEKILGILAGIGAFFSAIFFVLFRLKKEENKQLEEKNKNIQEKLDSEKKINEIVIDSRKNAIEENQKNEKKIIDAKNGNTLDNFNALNDILCNYN